MSRFAKLMPNAFDSIQMNAGIIAKGFNTTTGAVTGIIGVTSGGINFTVSNSFKDFGEDMDNVPKNTMQLKRLDSIEAKVSGTFATIDVDSAKLLIGAADIAGEAITPSTDLRSRDFEELWIIGDYSSNTSDSTGGFIAIHMMNSLSTGGFQMQTTDKDKGKFAFEFTAHFDYDAPGIAPYAVFIHNPT